MTTPYNRAVVPAIYLEWLRALAAVRSLAVESLVDYPCSPCGFSPPTHYLLREELTTALAGFLTDPARLMIALRACGQAASYLECQQFVRTTRVTAEGTGALLWQASLMMVSPDEIFDRLRKMESAPPGAAARVMQ